LLPKIKVEIACLSNQVAKIIKTITSSAKTGKIGDGKILVYGLDMWCVFAPAKPTLTRSERRFPPALVTIGRKLPSQRPLVSRAVGRVDAPPSPSCRSFCADKKPRRKQELGQSSSKMKKKI
jgi:Nitrogen regulatory protein P-II